jgi:hypothetical protein
MRVTSTHRHIGGPGAGRSAAPVHLPLHEAQLRDLSLGLPVGPGQCLRAAHEPRPEVSHNHHTRAKEARRPWFACASSRVPADLGHRALPHRWKRAPRTHPLPGQHGPALSGNATPSVRTHISNPTDRLRRVRRSQGCSVVMSGASRSTVRAEKGKHVEGVRSRHLGGASARRPLPDPRSEPPRSLDLLFAPQRWLHCEEPSSTSRRARQVGRQASSRRTRIHVRAHS